MPECQEMVSDPGGAGKGKERGCEGSGHIEADRCRICLWKTLPHVEDLDPDDLTVGVQVEDDARPNILRFGYRGVIQPQVEGVGLFVEMNLHISPLQARSKYAVMTRHGSLLPLYTTVRTNPGNRTITRRCVRNYPCSRAETPLWPGGGRGPRVAGPGRSRRGRGRRRWRRRDRGTSGPGRRCGGIDTGTRCGRPGTCRR